MSLAPTVIARLTARRTSALLVAVLVALSGGQVAGAPPAAAADALPVTYQGPTYPTAGGPPSADKPQSKLWHNDGAWWGLLRTSNGVSIHRLVGHAWQDTGTVVDERLPSTADALWEDGRLYVASRVSNGAMRVIQLSYDTAADRYAVLTTTQVASSGTESITIARDSLNRLWVTFTQQSRVYVAHTTVNDATWTAPFLVPVPDNTVNADDISAVIAFESTIGVMYSDQDDATMWFATHADGDPTDRWTLETALSGPGSADDHINLKALLQDDDGRIYAATKTSNALADDPSIMVLQRSVSGTWSSAVAATIRDGLTRAQLALDRSGRRLYVLMADEGGGSSVYYKSTPLGALSFGSGRGGTFITWPGAQMNDPSTTKQAVDATTGLVVLASDDKSSTKRYYHAELSLGGTTPPPAGDTTAPSVPTGVVATTASSSSIALSWQASTDDVGVARYAIFRNGTRVGTSPSTSFSDTGLAASTSYGYTVAAEDAAGNASAASGEARATTSAATSPTGTGTSTPAYVSSAVAQGSTASTSVASPAGVVAGDVLVAAVSVRGTPSISTPAGWTLVRLVSNGFAMRQAVFVRVASSSNEASTWTLSKVADTVVQVVAYRGVDTTSPVTADASALSSTATIISPAVSSPAGSRVVSFASTARTSGLTPADPLVERSEITTASTARYKLSANSADTTTSTGPFTTTTNGSSAGIGQTIGLRAAS